MKSKISRILGVGLTVMLLTSLLVVASPGAPASADVLAFGFDVFLPGPNSPGLVIAVVPSADPFDPVNAGELTIVDMAVSGSTIYAATGADLTAATHPAAKPYSLLKSTNGGASWEDLSRTVDFPTGSLIDLVSVAPDDPDMVVVVTTGEVPYYSSNGGATWVTLGTPTGATINDIAVSGLTGGYTYVVAGGSDSSGAQLWTMKLAMAQGWMPQYGKGNASGNSTASQDAIKTVALSPNFQIDKIVGVVSYNATYANFQCFRYEEGAETWNGAIAYFESWRTAANRYGIELDDSVGGLVLNSASIAFLPSYDGTDDGERIAFVGWADDATTPAGKVMRLTDSYPKAVTTWSAAPLGATHSVAYHEAGKLLVGMYNSNEVYACLTPMATDPMAERVNSMKQPGGTSMTTVAWSGDTAIAATQGNESCFSVSTDDAYSFNDISMIKTLLNTITDVAVSADAAVVYVATYDSNNDVSIWANKMFGYDRVLSMKAVTTGVENIAIRIAPEDPSVVYLNSRDQQEMWVSKDGGKNKWKSVPCYKLSGVQDFVVESADVLYAISTTGLSKSTNSASSWSVEKGFEGKPGYMITLAPNNDVLIGCSDGNILYSKDGGSTLVGGGKADMIFPGNAIVVADNNYADNGIIYCSTGGTVNRGALGPGAMYSNRGIKMPDGTSKASGQAVKGMVMTGDVLYVLTSDGTDSELWKALNIRDAADAQKALWGKACFTGGDLAESSQAPQPLKIAPAYFDFMSGAAMPNLYAVAPPVFPFGYTVRSFADWLAFGGITLASPATEAVVDVNPLSGRAYDLPFNWNRVSDADVVTCQFQVATDPDFNALLVVGQTDLDHGLVENIATDIVSVIVGPSGAVGSQFMPNTTYYWRVRVSQIRGAAPAYTPLNPWLSPWSETRSFRVEGEIPFSIISPEVGAIGVSLTTSLSWTEYPGAIGYEVAVAEDPTFAILDVSHSADYNFYHIEEPLKYSTTYYWRVRAITGEAQPKMPAPGSDWEEGVFTTEAEPVEEEPLVIVTEKAAPPAEVIQLPAPPAKEVPVIPDYLLWTIVGIGAVLLIALIVLIVRTRRVV